MKKLNVLTLLVAITFGFSVGSAEAATRKGKSAPKSKVVSASDVFDVQVSIKVNGKNKKRTISCLDKTPGQVKQVKGQLKFTSFSVLAEQKGGIFSQLKSAGTRACKNPSFLSLKTYNGKFGPLEAHMLFNRFGFGATPEEVAAAVGKGLDRTVRDLLTPVAEPELDAVEGELRCDGYFAEDPRNEACEAQDPNDFRDTGVRFNLYYRFLYSRNQFFNKLFWWLHNERIAASSRVLDGCERHALLSYIDVVRRAAFTGDYVEYMTNLNNDHLAHMVWLDGQSNHGNNPNENYAREFWELGTVGPTNLDGTSVYSSLDIAQSALAFTGWTVNSYKFDVNGEDRWVCYPSFVNALHYPGAKTIFAGTRYQASVENAADVVRATFAHPRAAEHLAEDIWTEFINPNPSNSAIKELAALIRHHKYNLLPVFERVMKSQALFAENSRGSLAKHPVELLIGFLRDTGIPRKKINFMEYIDYYLDNLGERPLLPPTVFGWDENRLAGEAFVLNWRNVAAGILSQSNSELQAAGYSLKARFFTGLPANVPPATAVINRVTEWLGISLNPGQIAELDKYLNWTLTSQLKEERSVFDAHLDGNGDAKLRGLLLILAELPEYRVK